MKNAPSPPPAQDKTPHERFTELGRKVMAVPKREIDARETRWQKSRKKRKR